MNSGRTRTSLSYLNLALDKNRESNDMPQMKILERVYQNHNVSGNTKGLIETLDEMLKVDPSRKDLEMLKLDFELKQVFEEEKPAPPPPTTCSGDGSFTKLKEFQIIAKVCSGAETQTPQELSKLRCRFVSKSPFSIIAPFKVEEANLEPYIAVFHDVMSDMEMDLFKNLSKPTMFRAKVISPSGQGEEVSWK